MSFSEWEFFYGVVGQRAYVDVSTPLVGNGSLRLTGVAAGPGAILGRWGQAGNRGFRQGRVTTLIQPLAGVAGRGIVWRLRGHVAGRSDRDHGDGLRRRARCWPTLGSPPGESPAGWGSPLTVLQTLPVTMAFGDTLALMLQWLSESSFGTALRVAIGSALDYTDLKAQATVQDAGVLLQSSEGEGPMAYLTASGDCRFDQTQNEEI